MPRSPDAQPAGVVGLIGLGLVGRALAQRLRAAGYHCIGHDLRAEACADFASDGHQVAESVPALARLTRTLVLAVFDTRGVVEIAQALMALGETPNGLMLVDWCAGQRLRAHEAGFVE